MRLKTYIFCAVVLLSGCDSQSFTPDSGETGTVIPDESREDFICCAVAYPDGYNWRRDSLYLTVHRELRVYMNDSLVRCLPEDAAAGIDTSAEGHILSGSSVLSYARGRDETVVSMDGRVKGRFPNTGALVNMVAYLGDAYTLWEDADNHRWALYKNGELLEECTQGAVAEGLSIDNGELCFAYNLLDKKGVVRELHFRHGNQDEIVSTPEGTSILAIRRINGLLNILIDKKGRLEWETGMLHGVMGVGAGDIAQARFLRIADKAVLYLLQKKGASWQDCFYKSISDMTCLSYPTQVYAYADNCSKLTYLSSYGGTNSFLSLVSGEDSYLLGPDMIMISPSALCCGRNGWYAGFNHKSTDSGGNGSGSGRENNLRPVIIHGADTLKYDFNGYFTYISLP